MREGWKRAAALVGLVGLLGLAACEAEVDPTGDGLEVEVDTSPSPDDGE